MKVQTEYTEIFVENAIQETTDGRTKQCNVVLLTICPRYGEESQGITATLTPDEARRLAAELDKAIETTEDVKRMQDGKTDIFGNGLN